MTTHSSLGPVKLVGLLQRRLDLSLSAFRDHWRTVHSVEALKLKKFYSAYIQNHRRDEALPGLAAACDGAPELWFDGMEDILALQQSEEYMTGAYVDEPNFMEGRSQGLILKERVVTPGPVAGQDEAGVRAMVFLRRRFDKPPDALRRWMAGDDAPLISLSAAPMRHVRALSLPTPDGLQVYDGVESYWWPDIAAFKAAWGEGEVTDGAANWIDLRACAGLLCRENRVAWPGDGVDYGA